MSYQIAEQDGTVIFRTAKRDWACHGGHDGQRNIHCMRPILKGTKYVEYVGEVALFQSDKRYHLECAAQQGLLETTPCVGMAR